MCRIAPFIDTIQRIHIIHNVYTQWWCCCSWCRHRSFAISADISRRSQSTNRGAQKFIIDNYFKNVATGFGDKPRQWFSKWRNILSKIVCELNDGLPMSHLFRLKVNINQPQNARFILYIISTHFENPLWMNIRCMSKNQRYNYQSKPAHQQQFYSTTQK